MEAVRLETEEEYQAALEKAQLLQGVLVKAEQSLAGHYLTLVLFPYLISLVLFSKV